MEEIIGYFDSYTKALEFASEQSEAWDDVRIDYEEGSEEE